MDSRLRKGLEINGRSQIVRRDGCWIVPSQTKTGVVYRVQFGPDQQDCTCPDFELIEPSWCKHIYAVKALLEQEKALPSPKPRSPQRVKFPREWPVYNEAKANELPKFERLLYDLCQGLQTPEPSVRGGRPRIPMSDLVYAAVTKVYKKETGRNLPSCLAQANKAGLISQIPQASTILNFFNAPDTADILRGLIGRSCSPLGPVETKFAVDSTTFPLNRYKYRFDKKQNRAVRERDTVKANLIYGINTHIVSWVTVTGGDEADSPEFPYLLNETAKRFRVLEVMADKAYRSAENFEATDEIGAFPLIPFSGRNTGWKGGVFQKMYHYYQLQRQEFKERYNQRANAESAHSMLKRRFKGPLNFRGDHAIENEMLAMVLVHNICCLIQSMFELGIEVELGQISASN